MLHQDRDPALLLHLCRRLWILGEMDDGGQRRLHSWRISGPVQHRQSGTHPSRRTDRRLVGCVAGGKVVECPRRLLHDDALLLAAHERHDGTDAHLAADIVANVSVAPGAVHKADDGALHYRRRGVVPVQEEHQRRHAVVLAQGRAQPDVGAAQLVDGLDSIHVRIHVCRAEGGDQSRQPPRLHDVAFLLVGHVRGQHCIEREHQEAEHGVRGLVRVRTLQHAVHHARQ
mmetsp:Transcript_37872/g.63692  ORF Transcript_37872/g.63692 Transcript_37872/m.63692 type:complete len:229 (-) Transcript_37872:4833-5519(-)